VVLFEGKSFEHYIQREHMQNNNITAKILFKNIAKACMNFIEFATEFDLQIILALYNVLTRIKLSTQF